MRVSTEDLDAAICWLRSYDPAPDEDGSGFERVANWLQAELDRRKRAQAVRYVVRATGASRRTAQRILDKATSTPTKDPHP